MRASRSLVALLLVSLSSLVAAAGETILPVPLMVNGRPEGEIPVRIVTDDDMNERVEIQPASLAAVISGRLLSEIADHPMLRRSTWRPLSEIEEFGLVAVFDWDELLLRVTIPKGLLSAVDIPISGTSAARRGVEVLPASFSAIANLDAWARYAYEEEAFEYRVASDVALNVFGAVVEAKGTLESRDPLPVLDYARITWDLPTLRWRVQGGDLTYRDTSLQGVPRIAGVSFATEDSHPRASGGGRGFSYPIVLSDAAEVRVTRNGSQIVRRTLGPGSLRLTDWPLVDGLNELAITWPTDEGVQTVELVVPHDTRLLDAGRLDVGVAVGIADRDPRSPLATASVAYGLVQPLTVGARFGSAFLRPEFDAGIHAVLATRAGAWRIGADVGIGPDDRLVADVPVTYRLADSRPGRNISLGLTTGAGYERATEAETADTWRAYASGFVGFALADGFSITPRASYAFRYSDAGSHEFRVVAGLRKGVRGGTAIAANLGVSYHDELQFLATLTYSASFPEARQNLLVQPDLAASKASFAWNRYAGDQPHDYELGASAQIPMERSDLFTVGAQAGYRGPQLRATLSHGLSGTLEQADLRNLTSLSARTALLFAGGVLALSAPVTDSFVLVTADPGNEIPIGLVRPAPLQDRPLDRRPFVFGGVRSYVPFQVVAEPIELVPGSGDEELAYHVVPTYRSGTVVRPGITRNAYVGGILLDRGGTPHGFAFGSWQRVDDPDRSGAFFTDDAGYFEIYNLAAGDYTLSLPAGPDLRYEFSVRPGASDFVDLGTLRASNQGAGLQEGRQ